MDTANANRCPATGRSASACLDSTHVACYAGHRASVALDRKVEWALDHPVNAGLTRCPSCACMVDPWHVIGSDTCDANRRERLESRRNQD